MSTSAWLITGSQAAISACGQYRYVLRRRIPQEEVTATKVVFLLINPSKANGVRNDPTARRTIGFAKDLGASLLTVLNLFALIDDDPDALLSHPDPVGPQNDAYLRRELDRHAGSLVIAGWGTHPAAAQRIRQIYHWLPPLHALAVNQDGSPRHPLYIKKTARPVPWTLPPEKP